MLGWGLVVVGKERGQSRAIKERKNVRETSVILDNTKQALFELEREMNEKQWKP